MRCCRTRRGIDYFRSGTFLLPQLAPVSVDLVIGSSGLLILCLGKSTDNWVYLSEHQLKQKRVRPPMLENATLSGKGRLVCHQMAGASHWLITSRSLTHCTQGLAPFFFFFRFEGLICHIMICEYKMITFGLLKKKKLMISVMMIMMHACFCVPLPGIADLTWSVLNENSINEMISLISAATGCYITKAFQKTWPYARVRRTSCEP